MEGSWLVSILPAQTSLFAIQAGSGKSGEWYLDRVMDAPYHDMDTIPKNPDIWSVRPHVPDRLSV